MRLSTATIYSYLIMKYKVFISTASKTARCLNTQTT